MTEPTSGRHATVLPSATPYEAALTVQRLAQRIAYRGGYSSPQEASQMLDCMDVVLKHLNRR